MDNLEKEEQTPAGEAEYVTLAKALSSGYGDPRFYKGLEAMAVLHSQKNKDYAAGGKQGHLGNFTRTAIIKNLYPGFDWSSPFGTAMDFMLKQLDAAFILYAQKRGSVTGEDVPTRLKDVGIYSVIGSLLWKDEQHILKSVDESDKPEQETSFCTRVLPICHCDYCDRLCNCGCQMKVRDLDCPSTHGYLGKFSPF